MEESHTVESKRHITRSLPVVADKVGISRRSLVLGVAGQHALNTDADAFDILDRAPACAVQEVQADDSVGVDVGVYWDGTVGLFDEEDLGCFCGVRS